jgi:hypothetical protein
LDGAAFLDAGAAVRACFRAGAAFFGVAFAMRVVLSYPQRGPELYARVVA